MFSRVCCATGWTWDYVGEYLTLPRLLALCERWKMVPPVDESVAIYLGIKPAGVSDAVKRTPLKALTNADIVLGTKSDARAIQWKAVH